MRTSFPALARHRYPHKHLVREPIRAPIAFPFYYAVYHRSVFLFFVVYTITSARCHIDLALMVLLVLFKLDLETYLVLEAQIIDLVV